ncbi:hypothetical protein [Thermus amyloliquefaciens]|uniref:hypothetical protein n=1 Tax=Thermus amyloliquefaciens TaxID=1449080 RepID=UPI00056FE8B5|nr:hypothetical protein [Thermus amyloliquefaciens]
MLTWVDLLALLSLAVGLAWGYRSGLQGAFAGLGVALYLLLAQAGLAGPWWGLGLGLLLGVLAKSLPLPPLSQGLEALLGSLGGFFLGLFLALALWTGYPWERTPAGTLRYPSLSLPTPVYEGVSQSPFAREAFRLAWTLPWLRRALGLGQP